MNDELLMVTGVVVILMGAGVFVALMIWLFERGDHKHTLAMVDRGYVWQPYTEGRWVKVEEKEVAN